MKLTNDKIREIRDGIRKIENRYCNIQDQRSDYTADNDIEYDIQVLKNDIEDIDEDISDLQNRINRLIEKKILKQKELQEKEDKLPEYEAQMKKFAEELKYIEQEQEVKEQELKLELLKEFYNFVMTQNKENSMQRTLSKDTKTIDLLDVFVNSKKNFLVLNSQFTINYSQHISLIVTYNTGDIEISNKNDPPTMTELKTNSNRRVSFSFPDRMQPIVDAVKEILSDKNLSKIRNKPIPFKTPLMLGGQTSEDRTGYGWQWEWGYCVSEGTEYGQTTKFIAAGIIIKNYDYCH